MTEVRTDGQVRRRKVVYVPGYDPMPPRRYRELYRRESAAQAEFSGYQIEIQPKPQGAAFGWRVEADIDGKRVQSEIDVLVWSDIVQDSMTGPIPLTYWRLLRTAWTYVTSGALHRLVRLRKGPVIAAFYPVVMLTFQAVVALALGLLAAWAVRALAGAGSLADVAGVAAGLSLFFLALRWFRARDGRFYAYYLMHDYAFTARWCGAYPPTLLTRIDAFAARIAEALRSDVDEVLVVGHSSGVHVAASALARALRHHRVESAGPALSFLSLGQVVPMMSFLPAADRLRADLHDLSASPDLFWVDISAPGDGCAFALCDPVAVSGAEPAIRHGPLVLSAAFSQTLSPDRWAALRWRFFRLHFQYLCAFDRPGHYDYFRITAGPMTLRRRYEGQAPSRSRILGPVSKHRARAA